jgi:hypothetical protein
MRTKGIVLALCVGLIASLGSVHPAQAKDALSDRLVLSCNTDGTYTCANSCRTFPYNGIGCCEM